MILRTRRTFNTSGSKRTCLQGTHHDITPDSPVVPVTPTVTGLACPECGVYFPSTKTLRQHLALKHKKLVTIDPNDAKNYQPHQHSLNGMPQCKHCKKNLQTWGALRQHVLTYACRPQVSLQATPPPHTPDTPTEGKPHSAPVNTLQEHWEGEAHTRQEALNAPASASTPEPSQDLPVLRRPENKHALLAPPVALTTLHAWAKELNTHCGFCNQWIARNAQLRSTSNECTLLFGMLVLTALIRTAAIIATSSRGIETVNFVTRKYTLQIGTCVIV